MADQPDVSIIVATFKRPEMLRDTLRSCFAQRLGGERSFEVIVVDNCPDGSAEPSVRALMAETAVPLRYIQEPRPGISHARNTGLETASADCIAFIDDDETAGERWLDSLLETRARYDAMIVFGPVIPNLAFQPGRFADYFEDFYTRDARVPTGTTVPGKGAGNVLIDRRCLFDPSPFAPEMGLTGGEDSLFFAQLKRNGVRFIWCAEAIVQETIPASRLRLAFTWERSFRGSQIFCRVRTLVRPPRIFALLRWMAVGIGQVLVYTPITLFDWALGRASAPFTTRRLCSGLGKVLWIKPFRRVAYGSTIKPPKQRA